MVVEYRGSVIVLDNGSEHVTDLMSRVENVFPNVFRMAADRPVPDDRVIAVGRKHLDVKTVVHQMYQNHAYWGIVANDRDPVVTISDYLSAARPLIADGFPAFVLISAKDARTYRRLAMVADVREPFTTGSLALAAVGLSWRTGATLDIILLGGDPANPPASWLEARELFTIHDDADLLDQAVLKAREIGLKLGFVALGESTHRDDLVLEAVRQGEYDLVLDDLRPIDVGPRIGRLKRVHKQLVDGDHVDTAYRLLRDAPCDVAIVVDAVRMNLVPASYVKAGAIAALSLGALGVAMPTSASASAEQYTAAVEAPLDAGGEEAAEEAAPAEQEQAAAPEAAATPAPAAVGTPAPAVEALPAEVSADQMAAGEQAFAQEQATLTTEQQELAELQAQQAAADQAVEMAETDLALEQQEVYEAEATAESAEAALAYADSSQDGLTSSEESQALGSYNRAVHDVEEQQQDVDEHKAALTDAQAQAGAAAEAVAAQQTVVDAQAANVASWDTVITEADARTDQVVSPAPGYSVTTHYGESGSNWSSGHHTGTDFAAPSGASVVSAADGVVIQAGWNGPYGNQIAVQHEDGTVTTYSHLSEMDVQVGQSVEAGQEIGNVGSTGNSTGPHLHFEVHDAAGGTMDSDAWLQANGVI